jgi:hypothetical protein
LPAVCQNYWLYHHWWTPNPKKFWQSQKSSTTTTATATATAIFLNIFPHAQLYKRQ